MKLQFTHELKERLFAQYIGQFVETPLDNRGLRQVGRITSWELPMIVESNLPLLLRTPASITDDELKKVLDIFGETGSYEDKYGFDKVGCLEFVDAIWSEPAGGCINGYTANEYSAFADYLRSIGVAIPFMGYSVEELVQAGWVKLLEQ